MDRLHLPSVEVISAQAESLGEALPHNSRDSGTLHLEHLLQVCSALFPPKYGSQLDLPDPSGKVHSVPRGEGVYISVSTPPPGLCLKHCSILCPPSISQVGLIMGPFLPIAYFPWQKLYSFIHSEYCEWNIYKTKTALSLSPHDQADFARSFPSCLQEQKPN